jgi:hypothetical protein
MDLFFAHYSIYLVFVLIRYYNTFLTRIFSINIEGWHSGGG